MKNKILYIFILIAILSLNYSCEREEWLELDLKGREIFSSDFIDNEEAALEVLNAAYDFLQLKYYALWSSYYILAELPSDDAQVVGGGTSDRPEYWDIKFFRATPENPALLQFWRRNYFGIYRANIVINELAIESELMDRYRAEAKFLRAYFYFELLRSFGDVVFYTENLAPSEYEASNTPREEILAQVEKDLLEAIPDLQLKSQQSREDLTKVSRGAAQALLGKVYIWQQKYDEAAQQFEAVINSGEYALLDVYGDNWKMSQEYGMESIFEIPYEAFQHGEYWENGRQSEGNIDVQLTGPRETSIPDYYNAGWGFDMVDLSLISLWDSQGDTARKNGTCFGPDFLLEVMDLDPSKDANGNGFPDNQENEDFTGYFQKKRTTVIGTNDRINPNTTYGINERIIRYSDVLLLAAEALNRKSSPDDGKAQQYVNRVRERVNLDPISAGGNELFELIKTERRMELAKEGHRFYDLIRWGDAAEVLAEYGFEEGIHELYPIPEAEIGVSNLVQNPGY